MNKPDDNKPDKLAFNLFENPEAVAVFNDLVLMITQLQRQLNQLQSDLDAIKADTKRIGGAVGRLTYMRPTWVKIRYAHRDGDLIFNDTFTIHFDKNEAELLGLLFSKKTGLPKVKKFYCDEVAKYFKDLGTSPDTVKAVHQTMVRIDNKVRSETRLEAFHVGTKEFYNLSR